VIPVDRARARARERRLYAAQLAGWLLVTGALIAVYLTAL
jgi:hypothetical protein